MTTKEEKSIEEVRKILSEIKLENQKFMQTVNSKVEDLKLKVENKHVPINLELGILSMVQSSMDSAIKTVLTGYDSPLARLITVVINENSNQLKEIISEAFNSAISTQEFKEGIRTAFAHKVAKTIISNHDGLYDKISNDLKQDATFKSKATLAISNIVNEYLNKN